MSITRRRFAGSALALAALLAVGPQPTFAQNGSGVAQLRSFVGATRAAEGEFEQTVVASSGRKPQRSAGSFSFARPGKFRWMYDTPYQQLLVGDGERLWTWDKDLNQVTVRAIGDALGATPAAVLFGTGELEENFSLAEAGTADGLDWVLARPRKADSGFESMRLGLAGGQLRRMEMRDTFGQTTLITFTRMRPNPPLPADRFRFAPPPGADVIGQ